MKQSLREVLFSLSKKIVLIFILVCVVLSIHIVL